MSDVKTRMKALVGETGKPGLIVPVQVVGRVVGSTPPPKPAPVQLLKQLRQLASRLPNA
jgi:hypothetical protein